jgi:molybdopterin-binding protein
MADIASSIAREQKTADACPKASFCRENGTIMYSMSQIRVKDAALYLGVSDDTVRRLIDNHSLASSMDESGRTVVDGLELAQLVRKNAVLPSDTSGIGRSARNRFVGLVTDILADKVMAQVELQCGPHRVVSLMSSEAVRELGLELGSVAIAVVKATTVIIETPNGKV